MTDEWIASNAEARVSFEERPESALHKKSKYHPRQWVVHSDPFYSNSESPLESHQRQLVDCSNAFYRGLKYPPTAVGGINVPFRNISVEKT